MLHLYLRGHNGILGPKKAPCRAHRLKLKKNIEEPEQPEARRGADRSRRSRGGANGSKGRAGDSKGKQKRSKGDNKSSSGRARAAGG
jgi:hypothetical protein